MRDAHPFLVDDDQIEVAVDVFPAVIHELLLRLVHAHLADAHDRLLDQRHRLILGGKPPADAGTMHAMQTDARTAANCRYLTGQLL